MKQIITATAALFLGYTSALDADLKTYDTSGNLINEVTQTFSSAPSQDFTTQIWLGDSKRHLAKIEFST